MEKINNPIFGESIVPSRAQEMFIKGAVSNSPVAVFTTLDEFMNSKGYELFVIKNNKEDFDVVYPPEDKNG